MTSYPPKVWEVGSGTAELGTSLDQYVDGLISDYEPNLVHIADAATRDDHTRYVLADGTRELSAGWAVGAERITIGTNSLATSSTLRVNMLSGDSQPVEVVRYSAGVVGKFVGSHATTSAAIIDLLGVSVTGQAVYRVGTRNLTDDGYEYASLGVLKADADPATNGRVRLAPESGISGTIGLSITQAGEVSIGAVPVAGSLLRVGDNIIDVDSVNETVGMGGSAASSYRLFVYGKEALGMSVNHNTASTALAMDLQNDADPGHVYERLLAYGNAYTQWGDRDGANPRGMAIGWNRSLDRFRVCVRDDSSNCSVTQADSSIDILATGEVSIGGTAPVAGKLITVGNASEATAITVDSTTGYLGIGHAGASNSQVYVRCDEAISGGVLRCIMTNAPSAYTIANFQNNDTSGGAAARVGVTSATAFTTYYFATNTSATFSFGNGAGGYYFVSPNPNGSSSTDTFRAIATGEIRFGAGATGAPVSGRPVQFDSTTTDAVLYLDDSSEVWEMGAAGGLGLPVWTTAGRPTGVAGRFGFNSTLSTVEFYDGTGWVAVQ